MVPRLQLYTDSHAMLCSMWCNSQRISILSLPPPPSQHPACQGGGCQISTRQGDSKGNWARQLESAPRTHLLLQNPECRNQSQLMRLELTSMNLIHPFMVVCVGIQNIVVIHSDHDRHLHQQNGLNHTLDKTGRSPFLQGLAYIVP